MSGTPGPVTVSLMILMSGLGFNSFYFKGPGAKIIHDKIVVLEEGDSTFEWLSRELNAGAKIIRDKIVAPEEGDSTFEWPVVKFVLASILAVLVVMILSSRGTATLEFEAGNDEGSLGIRMDNCAPERVIVKDSVPGSWAEGKGIKAGYCLAALDGKIVDGMPKEEFTSLMKKRPLQLRFHATGLRWARCFAIIVSIVGVLCVSLFLPPL